MYEYDKDFWRAIDELTWNQVKRCAKMVVDTLIGVMITIGVQPVRLYEYVRYRWSHRDEVKIECEANERFEHLKVSGRI